MNQNIKNCFKKQGRQIRKRTGRGEFDQSSLYEFMEISQRNSFV
jgi:hypothetical protein